MSSLPATRDADFADDEPRLRQWDEREWADGVDRRQEEARERKA